MLSIVGERSSRKVTMLNPHELAHNHVGRQRKRCQDEHYEAIADIELRSAIPPSLFGSYQKVTWMEDHVNLYSCRDLSYFYWALEYV